MCSYGGCRSKFVSEIRDRLPGLTLLAGCGDGINRNRKLQCLIRGFRMETKQSYEPLLPLKSAGLIPYFRIIYRIRLGTCPPGRKPGRRFRRFP